jgi:hypothetical protein
MMARTALLALFAFVFVVFFMAREAVRFQLVFIQITFVTSDTFRYPMLAQQRIFGLFVMIKQYFFPAAVNVTFFTLGTKAALVLIVFFMARQAVHWQLVLIQIAFVAIGTFHIFVLAR